MALRRVRDHHGVRPLDRRQGPHGCFALSLRFCVWHWQCGASYVGSQMSYEPEAFGSSI
jgi:hypothetical protein